MLSIIGSACEPTVGRRPTRQLGHGGAVSLEVAVPNFVMAACSHVSSSAGVPVLNDSAIAQRGVVNLHNIVSRRLNDSSIP